VAPEEADEKQDQDDEGDEDGILAFLALSAGLAV